MGKHIITKENIDSSYLYLIIKYTLFSASLGMQLGLIEISN